MPTIRESNDKELRTFIHLHKQVIVKFIDEQCEICKMLAPKFEAYANNQKYAAILFLKLDAKENPVSSKEVRLSGTPFFASYNKGRLIDCGLIKDEQGIKNMLDNLLILA